MPAGVRAQVAIGISLDEIGRAHDSDVGNIHNVFPLLDRGWRRTDCLRFLSEYGLGDTMDGFCRISARRGGRRWLGHGDLRASRPDSAMQPFRFYIVGPVGNWMAGCRPADGLVSRRSALRGPW
ncbi:hypothetical protein MCAG_02651 [Micromonospora sp. ATCC 39149]|nr:hypothetical protein MCAG_02651 [Micromonospora sp. ATCC 39149]